MEMHQIRYFLAVAETRNFTRAAEICHVAQPSLSRAVRKLEEELGGDLFRRERGQSHLTELGRTMLPLLRQSYEAATAAKVQAESYGSNAYAPLRLGLSLTVNLELAAPILAELAKAYPGLALNLTRAPGPAILEALKVGEIELALVADEAGEWERFDRWPLFVEGFVMLTAKGQRNTIKPGDLDGRPLIVRPYCESSDSLAAWLRARDIDVAPGPEAACDADVISLARHGLGVGLLPRSGAGAAEAAILDDGELTRTLHVYAVAGRQRSATAGSLLSLLRAADWPAAG